MKGINLNQVHFSYPLLLGDSHANRAAEGLGNFDEAWDECVDKPLSISDTSGKRGEYLMLNNKHDFFKVVRATDGSLVVSIDQHIADGLRQNANNYSSVVLSLDGNVHNANFMIERPPL